MERSPSTHRLSWAEEVEEEKKEEDSASTSAEQPDEVEEVHIPQRDSDGDQSEEQQDEEHTCGLFCSQAQTYQESLKPTECDTTTIKVIMELVADTNPENLEACAAMLDTLVHSGISNLEHVPNIVRCIYRCIASSIDTSAQHGLYGTLLELIHVNPHDVVVTLLRCAPSCDRTAAAMWREMASVSRTAEKVLLELLFVLLDWPLHRTCTSDGDNTDIFSLAATSALYEILLLRRHSPTMDLHFPGIFLALLYQLFNSIEKMSEELDTFWTECQQKKGLPTSPSRFIVLTVKELLQHLGFEDVVLQVECECGWDTLLNAETHINAMGLLAREMLHATTRWCYRMGLYLVNLLSRDPDWQVPAMAFLVELLTCPDMRQLDDQILQLIPGFLSSKSRAMQCLVLRSLMMLCRTPSTARRMHFLLRRLIVHLQDEDGRVVTMTLHVLWKVLHAMDSPMDSHMALLLAERVLPLFDNEDDSVQLISMHLFQYVMGSVAGEGKKPLKAPVHESLLPLFFHLYDENVCVAENSEEALLQAATFLKKRNLVWLLARKKIQKFADHLLDEMSSQAADYLRQPLWYLQSPQESIREAAIWFLGLAGLHVRGEQTKLHVIYEALQSMTDDISLSIASKAAETITLLRDAERNYSSRSRLVVLKDVLCRTWKKRPPFCLQDCLLCCASVYS